MAPKDPGICFKILNIPSRASEWDVTRAIAKVLHADEFGTFEKRLLNFRVKLHMSDAGGIRNDGSGLLILPIQRSGPRFLEYVSQNPIKMEGRKLRFLRGKPPKSRTVQLLAKTPYVNPNDAEEHQNTLRALEHRVRVDVLQFGVFYCESYPCKIPSFSIEWERDCTGSESYASLLFNYDGKLIVTEVGSRIHDSAGYNVSIHFSNIHQIYIGIDWGTQYICFKLFNPPFFEKIPFHRTLTGNNKTDNEKYKLRVVSLDAGHEMVSPYAPHLMLRVNDSDLQLFTRMCNTAGIAPTIIRTPLTSVSKRGFFTRTSLKKLEDVFKEFDWSVAFQLGALLHNGLLNTAELDELLPLVKEHLNVGEVLRRYSEELRSHRTEESPKNYLQKMIHIKYPESSIFCCRHVTITPTRFLLEGPYPIEENRVIRQFSDYKDHFIRVEFRDEDRLDYRWKQEVDSTFILKLRVGDILKSGFDLAGRHFEFLAYSTSSLREHTFWFMEPFDHPEKGPVTPNSIRGSLGDFEGDPTFRLPARYAARLGQAFTATKETVEISRNEWEEVGDLGPKENPHTDGVGTISKAFGKRIWHKLCEIYHPQQYTDLEPSAYQIRFLGYKGVVAVDEELDRSGNGIHMRLRHSMKKFLVKNDEKAPMEIAQAFCHPRKVHLNRPLVMVLEDLGVRKDFFLDLQRVAVAAARTIGDSLEHFEATLALHKMGSAFRLPESLKRLRTDHKMDLGLMDNPCFQQLRRMTMYIILRDILISARVPVPDSYMLVGVADEGPAYKARGYENVYCLPEGHIFACVQGPTDPEPIWLKGTATISRSPVTHVGDVQRVRLIGKPPANKHCFFGHLRNVVVLPSVGERSLASCLGGGDLDGDEYSIICHASLLPTHQENAASYDAVEPKLLDKNCTVEDICDFIVEYIHSDVLGLLSTKLLVIADQSIDGMRDKDCEYLAQLCSQAVDYPKRGVPVRLDESVPKPPIKYKPDWDVMEVDNLRRTDYYESNRALGHMFRDLKLEVENPKHAQIPAERHCTEPMADSITQALFPSVQKYLKASAFVEEPSAPILDLFSRYRDELRYICAIHTLSNTPGSELWEAEVVIGMILATCPQKSLRKERTYRMRHHVEMLIKDINSALGLNDQGTSVLQVLEQAWQAWNLSIRKREEFAANSFGLIALAIIFDCFDKL